MHIHLQGRIEQERAKRPAQTAEKLNIAPRNIEKWPGNADLLSSGHDLDRGGPYLFRLLEATDSKLAAQVLIQADNVLLLAHSFSENEMLQCLRPIAMRKTLRTQTSNLDGTAMNSKC